LESLEAEEEPKLSEPLTPRELQVSRLLAKGLSNRQIASLLFIGEGTVKTHVEHIIYKLGVVDRVQAAVWFAKTEPEVPEYVGHRTWFDDFDAEVRALAAQGEDSPTRIMHKLRQKGYLGGTEPIKDYLYPGWR
jgi:DNA-binding CsgD family transcriptional regulator